MEIAKFKKEGGDIYFEVKSGYAQPGSYSVFIWEEKENRIIKKYEGNFINTEDDKYKLPSPASENNGRIIDVGVVFIMVPPIKNYSTELLVTQSGNRIGFDKETGETNDRSKFVKLMVQLMQEE